MISKKNLTKLDDFLLEMISQACRQYLGECFFFSFYDHTLHYEINKITHTLVIFSKSSIWL